MTYRGHVENGVIVLEAGTRLQEGMQVKVEPVTEPPAADVADAPPWGEVFKDLIGAVDGLPADMAANHDHYIHGTPRK